MESFHTLPLKNKILVHIAYRDIFNFPVALEELKCWLDISGEQAVVLLFQYLGELLEEGLIDQQQGYYCVAGRTHLINERIGKKKLTRRIIKKCMPSVMQLSKIPYVKFIGISGSVAAENPTRDQTGVNTGKVDFDLFLIVKRDSIWIIFFFVRLLKNLFSLLRIRSEHILCMNYVMDESFLEIHNKNFYTATELYNLKKVYGDIGSLLYRKNSWFMQYYPGSEMLPAVSKTSSYHPLLTFFNLSFFVLFQFSRCLKRLSVKPALEIHRSFNGCQRYNLKRICPPCGGFQEIIRRKFIETFNRYFPHYGGSELFDAVFPSESLLSGQSITETDYDERTTESFSRYSYLHENPR